MHRDISQFTWKPFSNGFYTGPLVEASFFFDRNSDRCSCKISLLSASLTDSKNWKITKQQCIFNKVDSVFCQWSTPRSLLYHNTLSHRLRTPREEIAFTAPPKIQSQSQIFRFSVSIFCLPHRPKISDFFDLCLHWVSIVRDLSSLLRKVYVFWFSLNRIWLASKMGCIFSKNLLKKFF